MTRLFNCLWPLMRSPKLSAHCIAVTNTIGHWLKDDKRANIPIGVVLVAAVAAFATPYTHAQATDGNTKLTSAPNANSRAQDSSVSVELAVLAAIGVRPEREAPATVQARNVSRLAAEVSGTVTSWKADVGAHVQRGAVLVQLDTRDYDLAVQRAQAAVDASKARLALAQSQLTRSKDLVTKGFFSQEALTQRETETTLAQTDLRSNQAQLATAQHQRSKTTLRAPFAGTITERMAQAGETVAPGTVLMVLSESGAAEIQATVNPADVQGLQSAKNMAFESQGATYPVRLLRVSRTVAAPARTQLARMGFMADKAHGDMSTDPPNTPPAGTSGTVRWQEPALHIPPELIVRRNNTLGIFVQQQDTPTAPGRAQFIPLPQAQEGRASAVPARLPVSTLVVIRGQEALKDGVPLRITPAQ
jgi:RND family efflux transporter MFP subunit